MGDVGQLMYDEYLHLIGAVVRSGLQSEGPGYLLTADGRFWCELVHLDPEALMGQAIKFIGESPPRAVGSKCANKVGSA